jgi:hypothetical protein
MPAMGDIKPEQPVGEKEERAFRRYPYRSESICDKNVWLGKDCFDLRWTEYENKIVPTIPAAQLAIHSVLAHDVFGWVPQHAHGSATPAKHWAVGLGQGVAGSPYARCPAA